MDKPRGLDGELTRRIIKVMSAVNVRAYRATGGRVGGTWRVGAAWRKPAPICLLEHVGRRTGRARTTPLVFLEDGDRVVVVASQAGRPRHPMWFRNLEAEPDAHYFSLRETNEADLQRMALFDLITNNADRKAGHLFKGKDGKVYGIDHGLTFNEVPKLRTVMWQFAGMPIADPLRADIAAILSQRDDFTEDFQRLLSDREIDAFFARAEALHDTGCYPDLNPYRNIPYGWW